MFQLDIGNIERLWRTVKYEDVYLNVYANMGELMLGLTEYMMFYNEERFHQALGNDTPSKVYQTGSGGGAMILAKYGSADEAHTPTPARAAKTGQRRAAACEIGTA